MALSDIQIGVGLINDQRQIAQVVASAISQLNAQTALMLQIAPYLYDKVGDPGSAVSQSDIDAVGVKFQQQLAYLNQIHQQWTWIDQLNDPDPSVANAARASIDGINTGKSPLEDRYA